MARRPKAGGLYDMSPNKIVKLLVMLKRELAMLAVQSGRFDLEQAKKKMLENVPRGKAWAEIYWLLRLTINGYKSKSIQLAVAASTARIRGRQESQTKINELYNTITHLHKTLDRSALEEQKTTNLRNTICLLQEKIDTVTKNKTKIEALNNHWQIISLQQADLITRLRKTISDLRKEIAGLSTVLRSPVGIPSRTNFSSLNLRPSCLESSSYSRTRSSSYSRTNSSSVASPRRMFSYKSQHHRRANSSGATPSVRSLLLFPRRLPASSPASPTLRPAKPPPATVSSLPPLK